MSLGLLSRLQPQNSLSAGIINKRGLKTIAQVINLAQPKSCRRPAQVQKLVSGEFMMCPNLKSPSETASPRVQVVPVRICRRKDLERTCKPKLCDCPQKPPSKAEAAEVIAKCWMWIGGKSIVAFGLTYWTVSEGIWGEAEDSLDFYFRIKETLSSTSSVPFEAKVPRLDEMGYKFLNGYNGVILKIMDFLVTRPVMVMKKIRDAVFPCEPIELDPKKKKKKT